MNLSNNFNNASLAVQFTSLRLTNAINFLYFIASKIRFRLLFMILKVLVNRQKKSKISDLLFHFFDPNQIRRHGKWRIRNVQVQFISKDEVEFNLDLSEHVDYVTYLRGTFDDLYKNLIDHLNTTSKSLWNFIDVGANFGSVAISISKKVSVVAFEPQPELFNRLVNHSITNNCTKIQIENLALTSKKIFKEFDGVRNLYKPSGNSGATSFNSDWNPSLSNPTIIQAKLTTLDMYCEEKTLFEDNNRTILKIDVEGGELEVIQGASNFILAHRPIIVLEYRTDLLKENSKTLLKYLESISHYYIRKISFDEESHKLKIDDFDLNLASCNLALIPEEKKFYLENIWNK